ncbi:hypothetical protein SAMN04489761_3941 [Tenacibaculum sp. MAR_2009_124]|uniref:hypothetical protein n=1 Tax=Tenacibaculum sp. MAR_2009_124 TaxID=1250059 RepID=UPI000895C10D|nr:hypothetical protein [Tenacibaculum sp. MAR_2009_124]SEC91184.1 hypothetical protein SAMN04489761_3941 [Tenacibaculum sp. MAR_2009_124]
MNNDLKNSIDFLNEKTNKKNSFAVPENYFEEFDVDVLDQKDIDLNKQNPFKLPNSYFDSFDDNLFEKIKESNTVKEKVIPLYKKIVQLIPAAAAASVLIFATYLYSKSTSSINFNTLSTTEIENWYENGYIDSSSDELIIALNESDINFDNETFDSITLDDDNMEDYLNNLEENTIINEIQ